MVESCPRKEVSILMFLIFDAARKERRSSDRNVLLFSPFVITEPKYEYQNIRRKPFPWGMQSFFFNPKANYPAEL